MGYGFLGRVCGKTLLFAASVGGLLVAAVPSTASIVGSRHDLSVGMGSAFKHGAPSVYNEYGQVCVYCHTPHDSSTENGGALLWNRSFSSATYTLYSSPTSLLAPAQPTGATSSSAMCLSCHDGTIAVDTILNPPNQGYVMATSHRRMDKAPAADSCGACHNPAGAAPAVRAAFIGTDLSNDHPINMLYDNTVNTGLAAASAVEAGGLKLYDGKVECASCHDPHLTTHGAFLRKVNDGSGLCNTCHVK